MPWAGATLPPAPTAAQLAALNPSGVSSLAPTALPGYSGGDPRTATAAAKAAAAPLATQSTTAAGPFAGLGVFTASDPESALRLKGMIDWVAIRPDQTTPAQAAALRAAGFKVILWQDTATPNAAALVQQYGAVGYIAQAEGPEQLAAANAYGNVGVPKALISNNFMTQYPPGWIAMPEAYQNQQANATPQAVTSDAQHRGAQVVIPILGTYGGSGPGVAGYVAAGVNSLGSPGMGLYLSEGMSDADIKAVSLLRTSQTGGVTTTKPIPDADLAAQLAALNPSGVSNLGPSGLPGTYDSQGRLIPGQSGGSGTSTGGAPPSIVPTTGPASTAAGGPGLPGAGGAAPAQDYAGFLGFFGLPADIQTYVNGLFQKYDITQAIPIALAYIRGTPWYAKTYPGIQAGISKGLFVDERGYRDYLNQADQLSQRFLGHQATVDDISGALNAGVDINTYGKRLEAGAYINANRNDIQALEGAFGDTPRPATGVDLAGNTYGANQFTQTELEKLGEQQVGLTSTAGYALQAKLQKAAQRMQTIFQGTLASPRFSFDAGAPSLQGPSGKPPDIAR